MKHGLFVIVLLSSSGGHVDYPVLAFINTTRRQTPMCAGAELVQRPEHRQTNETKGSLYRSDETWFLCYFDLKVKQSFVSNVHSCKIYHNFLRKKPNIIKNEVLVFAR